MANKRQRAFAGFFAALFLLTSSALTIAVVYQAAHGNDSEQSADTNKPTPAPKPKEAKLENFTPITQPLTQLQATDIKPGTGTAVKPGDTVTVDYTGAVAKTGQVFQSSKDTGQPVSFSLSQVIAGWSQGIPGMKVGGTRRLLIPANLAYGANPPSGSNIPANADLVFDVTLHKIGK